MKKLILFVAAGAFAFTSCNQAPEVSMTADKTTAKVGEVISFENTTEKGFNYVWDFGDGSSSDAFAPTHVYGDEGTYTVTLSGSDRKGRNFGTATQSITIEGFDEEWNEVSEELSAQEEEFRLSLLGTYTLTTVSYTENGTSDCGTDSEWEENKDTEEYTFELLADRSVLVTDHLGNVSPGSWSVKKDNLLRFSGIPSIRCDISQGGTSTETNYSFFNGWFISELSGSTLSMSWTNVDERTDTDGDPCTVDEVTTMTLTKS